MSKVTVVGAGNVGATAANVIAVKNIASEVVLIDIKEGVELVVAGATVAGDFACGEPERESTTRSSPSTAIEA